MSEVTAYIIFVLFSFYCLASTIFNAIYLRNKHLFKIKHNYAFADTDIRFDSNLEILRITFFCFFAGALGGTIGLAGGLVLNPLFLSLGLPPLVVSATN